MNARHTPCVFRFYTYGPSRSREAPRGLSSAHPNRRPQNTGPSNTGTVMLTAAVGLVPEMLRCDPRARGAQPPHGHAGRRRPRPGQREAGCAASHPKAHSRVVYSDGFPVLEFNASAGDRGDLTPREGDPQVSRGCCCGVRVSDTTRTHSGGNCTDSTEEEGKSSMRWAQRDEDPNTT